MGRYSFAKCQKSEIRGEGRLLWGNTKSEEISEIGWWVRKMGGCSRLRIVIGRMCSTVEEGGRGNDSMVAR